METKQESKSSKPKVSQSSTVAVRVKRETRRKIFAELARVNKKSFGKKVRLDALILLLLDRLTEQDITRLQERSLSNADRLDQQYRAYLKVHAGTSKDEFLGILLGGGSNNLGNAGEGVS